MALLFWGLLITSGCFVAGSHDSVAATIQVQEGETAVLLFDFSGINLENQTFDIRRVDGNFTDSIKYVFSIRGGEENFEPQSELYKNRVLQNQTSLISGIVILKISSVIQSDSGVYLLTVPKLKKTRTLTLVVTKTEMKNKDGKDVNTTTPEEQKDEVTKTEMKNKDRKDVNSTNPEEQKDEASEHYYWFALIPVAVIFIPIIVLLKIKPWNPKDEEKSPSCEMKIRAKDSIDEEKELLRV